MLVLTRKTNEAIVIGDEIEFSVLAIVGDKGRIGLDAPRRARVPQAGGSRSGGRARARTAEPAPREPGAGDQVGSRR